MITGGATQTEMNQTIESDVTSVPINCTLIHSLNPEDKDIRKYIKFPDIPGFAGDSLNNRSGHLGSLYTIASPRRSNGACKYRGQKES